MEESALNLAIYLTATFAAAMVTGLVGFAFGLVAAAAWLHILSPLQTATLIMSFGLVVQGFSVWKLRQALRWQRLWPFLVGAAIGLPLGVAVLRYTNPGYVRIGVGIVLILFSLYSLVRPTLKPVSSGGARADAADDQERGGRRPHSAIPLYRRLKFWLWRNRFGASNSN